MKMFDATKMCLNKRRFNTQIKAQGVARFESHRSEYWITVYECQCCFGWHLTKAARKKA